MRIGLGDLAALSADCGPVPVASSYASAPFTPLTPEQSAHWDADYGVYQNCLQQSQGAPGCPAGSAFSGSYDYGSGTWHGSCVSTFTGQAVTAPITQAGSFTPGPSVITSQRAPDYPTCRADQMYLPQTGCTNKCPPGFQWDGMNGIPRGIKGLGLCTPSDSSGQVSSDSGISTPILLAGAGLAAYFLFFRHK